MIVRRAVLRLTLTYTAILLALYSALAVGVYAFVTGTFDYDTVTSDGAVGASGVELGFAHLRTGLLLGFGVLVVIAPLLSYVMARHALVPVKASYEAQERFVDNASHEFRTPLSVLQVEMELALSRPRTAAEYVHVLEGTLGEVASLTRLTEDLLLLARGRSSGLTDAFDTISLGAVVRTAAARSDRSLADGPPVTVDMRSEAVVHGSRELLTRAVGNLLDNARRHTPPNGTITVTVTQDGATATVSVADSGVGMSPQTAAHAFDRFWRGDESRSFPGHGLGLGLVQQIAGAHRGRASISPTPGGGTTVSLQLPVIERPHGAA
jgi:signal transduction histidine kinase